MRVNVMEETFENVTVFDQPMLFTCLRCDRETLPKGMYMYEVRHDDYGRGDPCEIADWIMVNHWGTVISNRPVKRRAESLTVLSTRKPNGTMRVRNRH